MQHGMRALSGNERNLISYLCTVLRRCRGVKPEQIFVGVGSDEAIDLIMRIFCVPGKDSIIITPPTYGMYKVSAKTNDVGIVSVPLTPTFEVRVTEVRDGLGSL